MLNLLILEDQLAVRNVMVDVIEGSGMLVKIGCAASIKQARELFKNESWNCMVSDFSLGDGQSFELIAELRDQGIDIPIILVSGFLSPDKVRKAKQLGIEEVIHKPFHPNALLGSLNKILSTEGPCSQADHKDIGVAWKGRMLPEIFKMDRELGLLHRMLNGAPKQKSVAQICNNSLGIAIDIVHAERGFLALLEKDQGQFVMMTPWDVGGSDSLHAIIPNCEFAATPFGPLLDGQEEFIRFIAESGHRVACWPNVLAKNYIAIPVRLQNTFIGVLCLIDCQHLGAFNDNIKQALGLLIRQLDTLLDNCAVHAALDNSMKETLVTLVRSLEKRDKYTQNHTARVGTISVVLANKLCMDEETIDLIRTGSLMHDIGKVGIPDQVLLKPGRLSEEEFAIMRMHPCIGDSILENMDTMAYERQIVRHHHERIDGYGYPDKLKGDEIPFAARIVGVADAIDAMTSNRVYRQSLTISCCIEQPKKNSGTQFDAQVVEAALAAIEEGCIKTQRRTRHDNFGGASPAFSPVLVRSS